MTVSDGQNGDVNSSNPVTPKKTLAELRDNAKKLLTHAQTVTVSNGPMISSATKPAQADQPQNTATVTGAPKIQSSQDARKSRNRNMMVGGLVLAGAALVAHNAGAFKGVSEWWNEGKKDLF